MIEQQKALQEYYTQAYYNAYAMPYGPPPYEMGTATTTVSIPQEASTTIEKVISNLPTKQSEIQTKVAVIQDTQEIVSISDESKIEEKPKILHPYGAWQKVDRKVNDGFKYGPKETRDDGGGPRENNGENPFQKRNNKKRKQLEEQEPTRVIHSIHYEESSSDDEEKKISKKINFFNHVESGDGFNDKQEFPGNYESVVKKQKMEGGKVKFNLKKKKINMYYVLFINRTSLCLLIIITFILRILCCLYLTYIDSVVIFFQMDQQKRKNFIKMTFLKMSYCTNMMWVSALTHIL